eukprot:TRINITY_DN1701_c0_g1_i1.p1 TRINITY_DN1701_c0_g1~~TRINITY_DN1701_c0_g1_i1.p1  ORF type:complete len:357 (+),score=61.53 TRINITY_DN1701_c0_g1_i1:58-1071(+)
MNPTSILVLFATLTATTTTTTTTNEGTHYGDGVYLKIITEGTGQAIGDSFFDEISVEYEGFSDGKIVDKSEVGGITFKVGDLVDGWRKVIKQLKPEGKYQLQVPENLANRNGKDMTYIITVVSTEEGTFMAMVKYYGLYVVMVVSAFFYYFAGLFSDADVNFIKEIPEKCNPSHPVVFFDVAIGNTAPCRIEFELFSTVVPKTAENFRALCTGSTDVGSYKGVLFHRIIPGFMCQGGDLDGEGGRSIYGRKFPDEFDNGAYRHSEPFLLSMANHGPHTNGSQFFVTTGRTSWLDGKHVVFGRVKSGHDLVRKIEKQGSKSGSVKIPVRIADCGQVLE